MVCRVLSSASAYAVQGTLLLIALGSLAAKFGCESPRRALGTFVRDVSKQVVGAAVAHGWNIFFATQIPGNPDQCKLYLITFVPETLVGVPLCYALHVVCQKVVRRCRWTLLECGHYPSSHAFYAQVAHWALIVSISEVLVFFALVQPLRTLLTVAANAMIDGHLDTTANEELIVVMLLVPLAFDMAQFWIQDAFLKFRSQHRPIPRHSDDA